MVHGGLGHLAPVWRREVGSASRSPGPVAALVPADLTKGSICGACPKGGQDARGNESAIMS